MNMSPKVYESIYIWAKNIRNDKRFRIHKKYFSQMIFCNTKGDAFMILRLHSIELNLPHSFRSVTAVAATKKTIEIETQKCWRQKHFAH